MAYAAVVSLKHTIHRLLNSPIGFSITEIFYSAYAEVKSLQQVLKRMDDASKSKRLNALDGEIRELVYKLEDSLQLHELNRFLPESEIHRDLDLDREINSFVVTVKKMQEKLSEELDKPACKPEEEEENDEYNDTVSIPPSRDFGVEMVGLSDEVNGVKKKLVAVMRPDDFAVFAIIGRAGSGRTIAANIIFQELCKGQEKSLDCGAWVTVGQKYEYKDILFDILRQVEENPAPKNKELGDEELLVEHVYTSLKDRKYMIVLDDVCDTKVWDYMKRSFPEQDNGSLVLMTTSEEEVGISANSFHISRMPDFDENPAWNFLCLVIFGPEVTGHIGRSCPPELEDLGRKIIKNCHRLRLVLTKVLLFLSMTKNTPELWYTIAEDKDNPVFMVDDEISEICRIKEDLHNSLPDDGRKASTVKVVSKMVDLSRQTVGIKIQMFPIRFHPRMEIFSIVGMAGLGKTTMVKKIFEDPEILLHFDHHAWITLGPNYRSEEFMIDILSKIYVHVDIMHLREDEKLVKDLCTELSNKRCLIVLDDLWNKEPLHYLQQLLPNIKGEIFVTTRLFEVAKCGRCDFVYKMPLLDEEQSWLLFCRKLFASELCPLKLEKAGKRICKNCGGLPLLILRVAELLSRDEMSPEYWEEVAEKRNSVFIEAQAHISNVLSPSYKCLPQHLKACFLYMGVFPQDYEMPTSKLIKMWAAEGFLEQNPSQSFKDFVLECLSELVDRSLVLPCKKGFKSNIKTCRLHSVFWHLSNSEAAKNKFFLTPSIDVCNSIEGIDGHRRLCIRHGILFTVKDAQDLMNSIPTAHSLLYTGPFHQYPVAIYLSSRLIRVLYALMIRFYEFPVEVLKLFQLSYLALTYNGELPCSISELRKLEYLIVSRHLSIRSAKPSYLPTEIWDLKELSHLQTGGGCLRNPSSHTILPKLLTLLELDANSCAKKVLKRIPNLKKLGIQIELAPDESDFKSLRCLNRISRLRKLKSLKCVVLNPELTSEFASPPPRPRSMFPSGLKKLSLSGLGYPWEYMSIIGNLQNLEVLKLRCYAFQGPRWETNYLDFRKLKYLLIEDTDLVCWKLTVPSFLQLEHVSIKHCFNFEELPLNTVSSVKMVEAVECNSVVMNWAEQMKQKHAWTAYGMPAHKNQITCSWDDGYFKK